MQCILQKPIALYIDKRVFSWLNCQFELFRLFRDTVQILSL